MPQARDDSPGALVHELAKLVRQNVPSRADQHHMIEVLTALASHVFLLRSDLQEALDTLAELRETRCVSPPDV